MNMDFILILWPVLILVVLGTIIYQFNKLGSLVVRYLDLKIEYLEKKLDQMEEDHK
jgi:hypothetical protein